MRATDTAHSGTYGRIRQHIVKVRGPRPDPHGAASALRDRFLRGLVHDGIVTAEQLEQSVQECGRMPSKYAWIIDASPMMLARADCAFLAEFGRFPTEDADFELNGPYQKICRSLAYDWHYYDAPLEKLRWDEDGHPYVRRGADVQVVETVRDIEVKKGNWWALALVLIVGFVGGPLVAAGIARNTTHDALASVFMFGAMWVVCFAGLVAVTLPRRTLRKDTHRQCGRCGRELVRRRQVLGCPICGLFFDEDPAGQPSGPHDAHALAAEPAPGS